MDSARFQQSALSCLKVIQDELTRVIDEARFFGRNLFFLILNRSRGLWESEWSSVKVISYSYSVYVYVYFFHILRTSKLLVGRGIIWFLNI